MANRVEKKTIEHYQDIDFSTEIFWPLAGWAATTAEKNVVVFQNGIVLLTKKYQEKINLIIRQMAQHFLPADKFYLADQTVINQLLEGTYEQDGQDLIEDSGEELTEAREDLREIIQQALERNVSDIHIEVRKKRAKIRLRANGDMFALAEWSAVRATRVCFVAFNRESDDVKKHFNSIIPHDASMEVNIMGKPIRVRLASIPAYPYPGFDAVFRILTVQENTVPLDQLGYSADQTNIFKRNMARKNGAIIMAGATGSGKTTTLASLIDILPVEKKVYTIEDPVEKKLPNATQIPTNTENPLCTFSSLVRQTLRMDPDCIVIGEVRDEDTSQMMSRAAITGHLVLTTLHANSAINIVLRLKDLGLDMATLTDPNFLSVLGYQTLIKKLCQVCKQDTENAYHQQVLGKQVSIQGHDENCPKCKGSGIDGRVVVAELIEMGEREFTFINEMKWYDWIKDLRARKASVVDQVLALIASGTISVEHAESAVGMIPELYAKE